MCNYVIVPLFYFLSMEIMGENFTFIQKYNCLYLCDFLMDFRKLSYVVIVKAYYN